MAKRQRKFSGSKKGQQSLRHKAKYDYYRAVHKRERNMARAITKHLKKHPNDKQAVKRIKELEVLI